MSRGPRHYRQHTTHRLNKGETSHDKFGYAVLDKVIDCGDGIIRTVYTADNEEFDLYIYFILEQMYEVRGNVARAYNRLFWGQSEEETRDWSDWMDRVAAINDLHDLNLNRKAKKLPKIPLFVEAPCTDEELTG